MNKYDSAFELITDCPAEIKLYEKKSELMGRITEVIKNRGMTQKQASKIIKCTQNRVSDCVNGKISLFSYDWLFVAYERLAA